ncbi:MAG: hypothetical protein JWQ27_2307 [Ferruginibacter sp.]|nr:hypothetical protein [Ferruginibacter sp.]
MRLIILLFLMANAFCAYSQLFIGDSKRDVKAALVSSNAKFSEAKLTDSTSRISWLKENEFQMIWVLNQKDTVIRQTLIPEKENGINEFVKWFNKDFVIISPTEWRNYRNGIIYEIKMENLLNEHIFAITLFRNHN